MSKIFLFNLQFFFKFFIGISLGSSGFYNLILNEFTENTKKPIEFSVSKNTSNFVTALCKFLIYILKFFSITICTLLFVILLNLFTNYRNQCCMEFYESFLNHPSHAKHIIKQLCLTIICIYVFYFSHKKFQLSLETLINIINYLFIFDEPISSTNSLQDDKTSIDQDDDSTEEYKNSRAEIYQNKNEAHIFYKFFSFFNSINENELRLIVLFGFYIFTLALILLVNKNNLFYMVLVLFGY